MIKIQSINRALPTTGKSLVFLAVGLLFLSWLLNTPAGLLGKADAVGYAVCHRIDVRSFHIGDRPLPLCSRCTGMYVGAVFGLIFQLVLSGKRSGLPNWRLWVLFGFIAAAFAVDGINSYMHLFPGAPSLYEPSNLTRLITGSGMGLIIAFVIYPSFNQTVWKRPDMSPGPGRNQTVLLIRRAFINFGWFDLARKSSIAVRFQPGERTRSADSADDDL